MQFGRLIKRLAILSICVVLLGGILSVVLLQPQISQIASAIQQSEELSGFGDEHFHDWDRWDGAYGIAEPALPVKAVLFVFGAALCVLFALWWLLVPAWLYQATKRAQMNALLWPLLGLIWSLWGLLLFLVVRSLLRQRCSSCGTWQRKASFCRTCGEKFHVTCPACGTACSPGNLYCNHCGSPLNSSQDSQPTDEAK